MDFHARLLQQLPETQVRGWKEPLPFYMAQPGYYRPGQEEQCLRDMEYLQQLYPDEIKKVRRRIAEILDLTDYEGSMIYDEYPDRGSVRLLAVKIHRMLKNEEKEENMPTESMVQVLLLDEIYKRRHGGRRGKI